MLVLLMKNLNHLLTIVTLIGPFLLTISALTRPFSITCNPAWVLLLQLLSWELRARFHNKIIICTSLKATLNNIKIFLNNYILNTANAAQLIIPPPPEKKNTSKTWMYILLTFHFRTTLVTMLGFVNCYGMSKWNMLLMLTFLTHKPIAS